MAVKIVSPYVNGPVSWLRGNLHAHTTNSDGARAPQEAVLAYAKLGYDFLMLSDHDFITQPGTFDHHGLVMIPGYEVTADGPHILHVNAGARIDPHADRQRVVREIAAQGGGLSIFCHPNRDRLYCHCQQELLEQTMGYTGIEIYNGVTRRSEGAPQATERWDRVLGQGRKVWGFANDDSHVAVDDGVAWNMVQCDSRAPGDIVQAMRQGRFYASTGVVVESIIVEENRINVVAPNAERIIAYGDYGRRIATFDGPSMLLTVPETAPVSYVRFECHGPGDDMAWLQPVFLTG